MKKEVVYRGMIINAEKGLNGRTVYRVLRFRDDGEVVPVPWTYATIESAAVPKEFRKGEVLY